MSGIIRDTDRHFVQIGSGAASGLHVIAKPQAHSYSDVVLGHYRVADATGAIAAGASADSQVFSFRWTDTTRFAVITKIQVTGMRATTAFAAGAIDIEAVAARSFTAAASGGTAMTITGNNGKMRTNMGTTLTTQIRIATTAALTAGTQTLDDQPFGCLTTHSSAGYGVAAPIVGAILIPNNGVLFEANVADGEHPLVLTANEGFVVRATVPATGVWNIGIMCSWSELAAF